LYSNLFAILQQDEINELEKQDWSNYFIPTEVIIESFKHQPLWRVEKCKHLCDWEGIEESHPEYFLGD